MTRNFAKFLDAIWTLSMGLFLGLTGGLVLSVIMTFRGAREIDATPGVEPYSDPMFAEYHNDAVAGYIGQDLFMVGGTVALVLLGLALLSIALQAKHFHTTFAPSSKKYRWIQCVALAACTLLMSFSAAQTSKMNRDWPALYETNTNKQDLSDRRKRFEQMHHISERVTSTAWLCGLIAVGITPWCRRIADEPSGTESESKQ